MKSKRLVIVGDSAFAEIACEYFNADSEYEVVAFSVEREYLKKTELLGLPIAALEDLEEQYDPVTHEVYVAVVYTKLNRLRTRLAAAVKLKGYKLASYVSSRAFVWSNVKLGEHCFIFENNTIQPFVEIGDNVVLWSGNHIGHHSKIRSNCFISSHVVISGFCDVGESCFIGVNASIANNTSVAADNWIGPGVGVMRNTDPGNMYAAEALQPKKNSAIRFFRISK